MDDRFSFHSVILESLHVLMGTCLKKMNDLVLSILTNLTDFCLIINFVSWFYIYFNKLVNFTQLGILKMNSIWFFILYDSQYIGYVLLCGRYYSTRYTMILDIIGYYGNLIFCNIFYKIYFNVEINDLIGYL